MNKYEFIKFAVENSRKISVRKSFTEHCLAWWNGSRLSDPEKQENIFTWQLGMMHEDIMGGFNTKNSRSEFYGAVYDLTCTKENQNTILFRNLTSGRRLVSTWLCTFVVPVLPLEIIFRTLNATVETWYEVASKKFNESNSLGGKIGWGIAKGMGFVGKVCAKVTDLLIVKFSNGLRSIVDSVLFGLVPIKPITDAWEAGKESYKENVEQKKTWPKVRSVITGVGQFFKTWGNALLGIIKGAAKVSAPVAIALSCGAAAPICAGLGVASSAVSTVPVLGPVLSPVLHGVSTVTTAVAVTAPAHMAHGAVGRSIVVVAEGLVVPTITLAPTVVQKNMGKGSSTFFKTHDGSHNKATEPVSRSREEEESISVPQSLGG